MEPLSLAMLMCKMMKTVRVVRMDGEESKGE